MESPTTKPQGLVIEIGSAEVEADQESRVALAKLARKIVVPGVDDVNRQHRQIGAAGGVP